MKDCKSEQVLISAEYTGKYLREKEETQRNSKPGNQENKELQHQDKNKIYERLNMVKKHDVTHDARLDEKKKEGKLNLLINKRKETLRRNLKRK